MPKAAMKFPRQNCFAFLVKHTDQAFGIGVRALLEIVLYSAWVRFPTLDSSFLLLDTWQTAGDGWGVPFLAMYKDDGDGVPASGLWPTQPVVTLGE